MADAQFHADLRYARCLGKIPARGRRDSNALFSRLASSYTIAPKGHLQSIDLCFLKPLRSERFGIALFTLSLSKYYIPVGLKHLNLGALGVLFVLLCSSTANIPTCVTSNLTARQKRWALRCCLLQLGNVQCSVLLCTSPIKNYVRSRRLL